MIVHKRTNNSEPWFVIHAITACLVGIVSGVVVVWGLSYAILVTP